MRSCEGLSFGTLFAVEDDAHEVYDCADNADDVGCRPGHIEADLSVHYVGDGDECIESTRDERHPNPLGLAVFKHPNCDADE